MSRMSQCCSSYDILTSLVYEVSLEVLSSFESCTMKLHHNCGNSLKIVEYNTERKNEDIQINSPLYSQT